jgi:hypothetical protein
MAVELSLSWRCSSSTDEPDALAALGRHHEQ